MNKRTVFCIAGTVSLIASAAFAGMNPIVGGKEMFPTLKNIIENAVNSADHTTLVAAVKAAGLVDTLSGPGTIHRIRPYKRRLR